MDQPGFVKWKPYVHYLVQKLAIKAMLCLVFLEFLFHN